MKTVRRVLMLLFGFVSGLIGLTSLLVSIGLMLAHLMGVDDRHGDVRMTIALFVTSELFLAFGIAASFVSLKCMFGPKEWIQRAIDVSWKKSIKYAFAIPAVGFGVPLILRLVQWFAG